MFRLNLILLLAVVLCAMAVVTSQHHARKLFQALEAEQDKARQLDIEYGQLQIEMSTWATHPRLEKIIKKYAICPNVGDIKVDEAQYNWFRRYFLDGEHYPDELRGKVNKSLSYE